MSADPITEPVSRNGSRRCNRAGMFRIPAPEIQDTLDHCLPAYERLSKAERRFLDEVVQDGDCHEFDVEHITRSIVRKYDVPTIAHVVTRYVQDKDSFAKRDNFRKRRMKRLLTLLERAGFCCPYCGADLLHSISAFCSATFDHVVPRLAGGDSSLDNLTVVCSGCNNLKGAAPTRTIEEGRTLVAFRLAELQPWFDRAKALARKQATEAAGGDTDGE